MVAPFVSMITPVLTLPLVTLPVAEIKPPVVTLPAITLPVAESEVEDEEMLILP
jgi:hypothetical protein